MVASFVLLTPFVDELVELPVVLPELVAVCASAVVAGSGVTGITAGRAGAETST